MVRRYLVSKIEVATGGRVEIASFQWKLLGLEAQAGGLVIHGLEAASEAPYVQVEQLRVKVSVLGILSPRIRLRDLEISRPQLHLIVYPDGSTNQPQPRKKKISSKPAIDTFFDLKTGQVEVEQGVIDYDNRAAAFDFQDRRIPLDFTASDLSLRMSYLPAPFSVSADISGAGAQGQESYRIEAAAGNLSLSRGFSSGQSKSEQGKSGQGKSKPQSVQGFVQATLDLYRTHATLNSLRITARSRGVKDRSLDISGALDDFAHPRWQARVVGELDMRLLNPLTGYPDAPEGIAHLDLTGAGQAGAFRADGTVHVDGGSYIGTGVVATGVGLDARVHADPEQLLITSSVARLRQGGQIDFDLSLSHWLTVLPGAATMGPSTDNSRGAKIRSARPQKQPQPSDDITIPVDGTVTSNFKGVALDTLLGMVTAPPFQRLGFDTYINGPATAIWTKGDVNTLAVKALLNLVAPAQAAQAKVIANGLIDATYTQRDGAVDMRKVVFNTPASQLAAHGHLGAYPLTSPSAFAVEFHSQNLGEFDTVLRDLGLTRDGKSGTAALPVALTGRADFLNGFWAGSLQNPRLSGDLKATQLTLELPANSTGIPAQPPQVSLDSIEANASYSANRIELSHAVVRRGKTEIDLSGSLAAAPVSAGHGPASTPSFDANSILHLELRAGQVGIRDFEPFVGKTLPLSGSLDAQLHFDGPLRNLDGSGWVEMEKGSVFGEPVPHIRAQGNIANQTINLTSLTMSDDAGKIGATGSYDLSSHRFQLDAMGAEINLAHIETLRRKGLAVTGTLGFTVRGSGTLDDPHLEAHATLPGLSISGESLGGLNLEAHTADHAVTYDIATRLEAADFKAHGKTALSGDYDTRASIEFSRFNIGALLKLAHVQGLNGESALAGTVTLQGPLAHLSELRGEAKLQQLEVTISGVHLKSDGGVHATLDRALIHLDPLHVTGEETDLHAQGTLSLNEQRQLDLSANGAINLKLAQTLDSDLTASGTTTFQVEAHGPLKNPGLKGSVEFQNGALSLGDLPNGLSQLHGTLEFNQDRLEVKNLTAMTGGGLLTVGGYLAYQNGLYGDLTAKGNGIRIRYPEGVSALADASLHLQGARNNLLLSGNVLITRFTVSPDLDIAALAAQANAVQTIAPFDAPSNHIRLDVKIASSPQLNFQNAYAKLAGNVDLQLRGTVASPSLLGRISITEGNATIAGTRYDLQRGDIFFTNPVRIQPSIDLNATARVEDYDITLSLYGTPDKLAVTYRSDPPLPEADVVALLALGRTGNQQRLYTQQQEQALANPTTDALLGGALNATVSTRVQKLFGAGSVKLDPNYLGALGNSTSRIIVEEQLGRNLTLTYATNVNTTSQQLIQAEIAINRHVSLQLARDESGVYSIVIKTIRRYR